MVDFPIVDSHVHVYDPNVVPFRWIKEVPRLNCAWLPQHYQAACGAVAVDKIVFVEVWVDSPNQVAEAQWVAREAAAFDPRIEAIVAASPLEKGRAIADDLAQLRELPQLRGIRRLIEIESDGAICHDPGFIEGVRMLAEHDLSFDLCVRHYQMADAVALARACPDVRIVLDHIGKPPIRDGVMDPWREHITALAALSHVHCKISGVVTEADHAHWTREQLRPYLDHVIEAFGFDRIMFGADWPVSEQTHRYGEWVDIVECATAGASESELRKLFRDNAIAFYRLD